MKHAFSFFFCSPQSRESGFSLVELSIVLVILGLLTGGILTGQSLIRAAELRSITTDFNNYQTAIRTFQSKYFALPGDMRNATRFWSTAPDCAATAVKDTGTCNGDGDGKWLDTHETSLTWQHLAKAGLIAGTYDGSYSSVLTLTPGVNTVTSKISGATFMPTTNSYQLYSVPAASRRIINFLSPNGLHTLNAEETWGIDKKIDDGLADRGMVQAQSFGSNCLNQTPSSASYILENDQVECWVVFYAE